MTNRNDHKREGKVLLICLPRSNVSSSLTVFSVNLNSFKYTSHGPDKENSIENSKPQDQKWLYRDLDCRRRLGQTTAALPEEQPHVLSLVDKAYPHKGWDFSLKKKFLSFGDGWSLQSSDLLLDSYKWTTIYDLFL